MKVAELAQNKGSSSWLTALPLVKYHFSLSKSDFRDAIRMRYGWLPERLPAKCVCYICCQHERWWMKALSLIASNYFMELQ